MEERKEGNRKRKQARRKETNKGKKKERRKERRKYIFKSVTSSAI